MKDENLATSDFDDVRKACQAGNCGGKGKACCMRKLRQLVDSKDKLEREAESRAAKLERLQTADYFHTVTQNYYRKHLGEVNDLPRPAFKECDTKFVEYLEAHQKVPFKCACGLMLGQ